MKVRQVTEIGNVREGQTGQERGQVRKGARRDEQIRVDFENSDIQVVFFSTREDRILQCAQSAWRRVFRAAVFLLLP